MWQKMLQVGSGGGESESGEVIESGVLKITNATALNKDITLPKRGNYYLETAIVNGQSGSPYIAEKTDQTITIPSGDGTLTKTVNTPSVSAEIETNKDNVVLNISRAKTGSVSTVYTYLFYSVFKY